MDSPPQGGLFFYLMDLEDLQNLKRGKRFLTSQWLVVKFSYARKKKRSKAQGREPSVVSVYAQDPSSSGNPKKA